MRQFCSVGGCVLGFAMHLAIVFSLGAQELKLTSIGSGFDGAIYATHAPGDPYQLYVVERLGRVLIVDLRNPQLATSALPEFLNISNRIVSTGDQQGLFSIAFDPEYLVNGHLYVHYVDETLDELNVLRPTSVIARYQRVAADQADSANEVRLLEIQGEEPRHFGGWLGFSPVDGFLYISRGDGRNGDPSGQGQNVESLLGTILRIDPDGSNGPNGIYGIPSTNPFVNRPGRDEIWAYGLRNPWRCSFERVTGTFIIADVGQFNWEEINFQSRFSPGGENYGWSCFEGEELFGGGDACLGQSIHAMPEFVYAHGSFGGGGPCAIIGGYAYRGSVMPDFQRDYFFSDACARELWSLDWLPSGERVFRSFASDLGVLGDVRSFAEDAFGELYVITSSGIRRVDPADGIVDCNVNGVDDRAELEIGLLPDQNLNGVPDLCDDCQGDANGDLKVDFGDITAALGNWRTNYAGGTGLGDADKNGAVAFADITSILSNWLGECLE